MAITIFPDLKGIQWAGAEPPFEKVCKMLNASVQPPPCLFTKKFEMKNLLYILLAYLLLLPGFAQSSSDDFFKSLIKEKEIPVICRWWR